MNYAEGLCTARANGISDGTYWNRVNSYDWDIKRAATTPTQCYGEIKALLYEFDITSNQYYHWRKYLPEDTAPRDIAEVAAARSRKREVANG